MNIPTDEEAHMIHRIEELALGLISGSTKGNILHDDIGEYMGTPVCFTISTKGTVTRRPITNSTGDGALKLLTEEVGGYIELFYGGENFEFYCNEEGRLNGMEPNIHADFLTSYIEQKSWFLVGPICLVVDEKTDHEITKKAHEQPS